VNRQRRMFTTISIGLNARSLGTRKMHEKDIETLFDSIASPKGAEVRARVNRKK
jgi:hypothetical protein